MLHNFTKITANKKSENIWIYNLEPANPVVGFILISFVTIFFILFTIMHDLTIQNVHFYVFTLIVFLLFIFAVKKSELVINCNNMTIKSISKIFFFRKNKIQPLTDFDSIKLLPRTEFIEEGYLKILYSLVLSGPTNSKEIVIFNTLTEARAHSRQLAVLLNLKVEEV